jgi:hypothetical protein
VAQGERAASNQRASLRRQQQTQAEAQAAAIRQSRLSQEAIAQSEAEQPDVSSLLGQALKPPGAGTSLLSQSGGLDPSKLKLGRSSLLGQ